MFFRRSGALGYTLPPLTGLRKCRPHDENFVSELLTKNASMAAELRGIVLGEIFPYNRHGC